MIFRIWGETIAAHRIGVESPLVRLAQKYLTEPSLIAGESITELHVANVFLKMLLLVQWCGLYLCSQLEIGHPRSESPLTNC